VLARRVVAFLIRFYHHPPSRWLLAAHVHLRLRDHHFGARLGALLAAAAASVVWAIVYFGATLGSERSATVGMRVMDLEMRTWYGAPAYFVLGAVHAVAFWFTVSFFTPFVCWWPSSTRRRRLLQRHHARTVIIIIIRAARPCCAPSRRVPEYRNCQRRLVNFRFAP